MSTLTAWVTGIAALFIGGFLAAVAFFLGLGLIAQAIERRTRATQTKGTK